MIENAYLEPRTVYRGTLTFAEFSARLKVAVRREHRELRNPEGDISPRVWFYFGDRVFEKQLDGEWFSSRDAKDQLTAQIVKMIEIAPMAGGVSFGRQTPVEFVGLVYTMFRSGINLDDLTPEQREAVERNELPEGVLPPLQDPNAEEIVSAIAIDPEISVAWHAKIRRHEKKPPRLGPWEDMQRFYGMPAGLMIDPIQEALR